MPSPTVSIVMSVYNDAARLPTAVDGVMRQTYPDWELIVINDGSTDGTGGLLDKLADRDPRLRVVHQENTGLTRALIRGCQMAQGRHIARQDADDFSRPKRLARQVALLESDHEVGFVSCWTEYFGPQGEYLETVTRPADSRNATVGLLEQRLGPPAHGSLMFRHSLYEQVGGYRPEFYFGQDSDLWLRMAERTRIAYVPEVLYAALRDCDSVSGAMRSNQTRFGELGHACRRARQRGESEAPLLEQASRLADEMRARQACGGGNGNDVIRMQYLIGSHLAVRRDGRGRRYLWPVIRKCPWHWRAWARLLQASCPIKKSRCAETTLSAAPSPSASGSGEGHRPRTDGLEDG